VRRLWRVVGAGFAACTLAFSALQVLSVLSLDSSVVRRSIPADGVTTLVVRADQGTVDVLGTETGEVSVEAKVRRSLVDADVSVRRDGPRAVVDGTCPGFSPGFCSVDVVVRVPSSVAVEVQGRDGDVTVRDITGSVVISSTDGNVVADDIGGPLGVDVTDGNVLASGLAGRAEVSTGNGAVGLSFRTAPDVVSVSTGDGDVDVVVPDGPETYRVDGTSADGTVDATVRTDPAATRSMALRSGAGSITVRYPA
jgi:hypothetical protein